MALKFRDRDPGPCGCFGISLERGATLFALFDIVSGLLLFIASLVVFIIGEFKTGGLYPSAEFNMRREVVITLIFLEYYVATTGLGLYFAAGFRTRSWLFIWIICNLPLITNIIKIYQIIVVFYLASEIKDDMPGGDGDFKNWTDLEPGNGRNGFRGNENMNA